MNKYAITTILTVAVLGMMIPSAFADYYIQDVQHSKHTRAQMISGVVDPVTGEKVVMVLKVNFNPETNSDFVEVDRITTMPSTGGDFSWVFQHGNHNRIPLDAVIEITYKGEVFTKRVPYWP